MEARQELKAITSDASKGCRVVFFHLQLTESLFLKGIIKILDFFQQTCFHHLIHTKYRQEEEGRKKTYIFRNEK